MVGEQSTAVYIQKINQLNRLKKLKKNCIPTVHVFWSPPNRIAWTVWISDQNGQISYVSGKYPLTWI